MLGKGGVGKSTVSAALGLAAARAGKRSLLIEVAGQNRLSRLFRGASVGHEAPAELAPGLFGVQVDVEYAIEEYLTGQLKVRPLVELMTRSRAFSTFAAAAPGLPELVTVGKVWTYAVDLHEDRRPVWDQLVVDCPATGHGIALLETAGNVEEIAGGGPIRDQAARIQEVVSHPAATGVAIVARPDELAISEAVEAADALRERGLPVAAAVLNGVRGDRFRADEEPALASLAATADGPPSRAAAAALRHLAEQRADEGYRRRLAEGTRLPVIELPELVRRRFDLAALDELSGALAGAVSRNGRP
ncbi:MAG TPA: ArsA-related P-loop ATPase [Miltoncostaeaceae bacterium]|nr:ArsA-related P-loop ATPase [Miltoncostaeaceae bacterium]